MNIEYKIIFVFFSLILFIFWGTPLAQASSFTVIPVVIDNKAKARDILKESVTLINNANRKTNIYTFVNNISISEGEQEFLDPSRADHASSLANWIEISRGVIELAQGEKRTIDLEIDVNLRAEPGAYHAVIYFAEGTTRGEAEQKISESPSVAVNVEVLEDIRERLQLKKFIPDKVFFSKFPVSFSYELENIGNRTVSPSGEIRIYNRRGEEVDSVGANGENAYIEANTAKHFASIWEASMGAGRYKAILDLEYGEKQLGTVQDTVFFWIIPFQQILIVFGALLLFVILIISFLHRRYGRKHLVFVLAVLSVLPFAAEAAEESLTLSVTPPLFQLTIGPGEFWASNLKVVNVNSYDLTLYASVMNFEASGEEGQGKFTPVIEEDPEAAGNSLANWIEVSNDPIHIPKESSAEISFSVRIPKDAPPGGHYAAILVGTQPVGAEKEKSVIRVSSLVSSLVFVRIEGEVIEEGRIREFRTDKTFYQKPDVAFTLRFENLGNVHSQPQGDIAIYNMWGKELGKISINHQSAFGNVLPGSIRKFIFEWKGEENFWKAGRYKAVVTLAFGKEARQNISSATYFWVVPLRQTAAILGGFILFFAFVVFFIRFYIKKSIATAQKEYGLPPQ